MTTQWMTCAVLLGLIWTAPSVTATPEEVLLQPEGEASVLRIHDISGLTQGPLQNQADVHMFPFSAGESSEFEPEDIELGDVIESLVYEILAPDAFEYEGRSFQRSDDGRLMVVAPPALQERIAQLIDGLRAGFGRTARITLDVYSVAPGRAMPPVIDQEEIGTMVNSGLLRLVHRRNDQVRMGYTERIEVVNSTTVVDRWEGEIAQESAIPAPELRELDTGIDLLIRVEDVPGSSAVRVRQSLSVSELRDLGAKETSIYDGVRLDNTVYDDESREALDLPVVSASSSTGTFVLEVGDGIVSVGHTATQAGGASWLTHLQVVEVDPATTPMAFGGNSVVVLDGSAATWPSFTPPRWTAQRLAGRSGASDGDEIRGQRNLAYDQEPVVFPARESMDWQDAFFESESGVLSSMADDVDPWEGRWTWEQAPWAVWAAPTANLERSVSLWPGFVGTRRNLVVEMGITELSGPGGAPREVARGRLSMESGSEGCLLFGDLVVLPRGFEVDVASGASIVHPRSAAVFDGLYLRAAADGPGSTVLVSVASSRLLGLEDVMLSSKAPDSFVRPRFALADARVKLPVDGQRRVIAELDGSFDRSGSRTLWVAVHGR